MIAELDRAFSKRYFDWWPPSLLMPEADISPTWKEEALAFFYICPYDDLCLVP